MKKSQARCRLWPAEPGAWLDDVLARIADHPFSKIDEHVPWNWKAKSAAISAAA
jgi:hypothetical protein